MLRARSLWIGGFAVSCVITDGEIDCEHAFAVLESCCGPLHVSSSLCEHRSGGCLSEPVPPQLSEDQSACIQELDCDTIRRERVCERFLPASDGEAGGGGSAPSAHGGSAGSEGTFDPLLGGEGGVPRSEAVQPVVCP